MIVERNRAARPKRRWFRFRLRTLFGGVTVLAVLMGWVAKERHQSHHERQVAKQLEAQGVQLTFGGPYDIGGRLDDFGRLPEQQPQGWWRGLARQVLGDRILRTSIGKSNVKDLAPLAGLTNLQQLEVCSGQVSDLAPLAGLSNLQSLHLRSTRVSDLSPLVGLEELQSLRLYSTPVRDLTLLSGLKNLQQIELYFTEVSDLSPLAGLSNLELLELDFSRISDEQVESLQRALPSCRIRRIR